MLSRMQWPGSKRSLWGMLGAAALVSAILWLLAGCAVVLISKMSVTRGMTPGTEDTSSANNPR